MSKFELVASNTSVRQVEIVQDLSQVEARLQELHPDLHLDLLKDVISAGLARRNDVTRASAPTAAGIQQWLGTVANLRTRLAVLGWHIQDQNNCPFINSPDHSISIVVMTGDKETGKIGWGEPTNQAEKGAVAEGFTRKNKQLELFNSISFEFAKENQKETRVWALLYHYDKIANAVRYELSLPIGFSKKKITEWGARIILGIIPNDPSEFIIRQDEPNAPATVEVEPRTGNF